eukprot:scaffold343307_cov34-Prasinocladus_malaysianus.AAC.1
MGDAYGVSCETYMSADLIPENECLLGLSIVLAPRFASALDKDHRGMSVRNELSAGVQHRSVVQCSQAKNSRFTTMEVH